MTLKDTWPRFIPHYLATTLGCFLRLFLPVLNSAVSSGNTQTVLSRPWGYAMLLAAMVSILGGINSNLPCMPRELVKSVALGFALDVAKLLH
jgi:hypothetical protein